MNKINESVVRTIFGKYVGNALINFLTPCCDDYGIICTNIKKCMGISVPHGAVVGGVPYWVKVTKTYADFATAALTNNVEIYSLAAKQVLHQAITHHTVSFAGGAIATYTLSVGDLANSATRYSSAFNVKQAPGATVRSNGSIAVPYAEDFTAVHSVRAFATSTVANLNAATAGSVDFYLLVSDLP